MSAEFVAEEGILKGLVLSLDQGEEWSIGRDPEQAQLVIEDPKAARKHVVCRKTPEGYIVENLSEIHPALVNDQPFSGEKLLAEGDRLTIGESVFVFYPEGAPPTLVFEPEYAFEGEEPFLDEENMPEEKPEEELAEVEEEPEEVLEEAPQEEIEEEEELEEEPEEVLEEEPEEEPEPAAEEEDELIREEIFEEAELPEEMIDLTPTARFLVKVIAGPNTGAEFSLDLGRTYLIGTDPATCDLIFNDLSVSREHARLTVSEEGALSVEDLDSRNGVMVDGDQIMGSQALGANAVVTLGTTAFLLIDREAPSETIVAPPRYEAPPPEPEAEVEKELGLELEEEAVPAAKKPARAPASAGTLILALFVVGLAVLFGIGMVSLLQTKDITQEKQDYLAEIQNVVKEFPAVRFTYNPSSGKLFLLGHVETGVQMNELMYKLKGLPFLREIENNIVNDEAVWQEMNILLSKIPEFKGVSMHAPEPGVFVISGYLKTEKQAADLIDYLNLNFNYLNLLQNRVVVDQQVVDEVTAHLMQHGFGAVTVGFSAGELVLTGYVSSTQAYEYETLVDSFESVPGVRTIKNYVVAVSPEQGVIDLNKRYPGKYRVTGFSKHGDVNINVVINGKILTRGDQIDDMTITSIQPHTIFLERDGLKYKIEYNK